MWIDTGQELIVVISMFFFLGLAAWFDANGTEVPDATTVPYALLGISVSMLQGRYLTMLFTGAILLLVLLSIRIPWLEKLNDKLMRRAYKTEEALNEETEKQANKANAFFAKHEERISKWLRIAYIAIPYLLIAAAGIDYCIFAKGATSFILTICAAAALILLSRYYMRSADTADREEQAPEAISAFGGADMIVLLGMWGFYGTELFLYEIAITFGACLIWLLVKYCITRKKQVSIALLPAIFFMAPFRIVLAVYDIPNQLFSLLMKFVL